jgi:Tfp pilus assembly protein PilX
MKLTPSINNEKGTALIISLMLLVLLTLLGMAATTTSTLEIMIADNERDYKVNFYKAESAAIQAAVIMENEPDPENKMKGYGDWAAGDENWLRYDKDASTPPDMTKLNTWDDLTTAGGSLAEWDTGASNVIETGGNNITVAYAAQFVGVKQGESLKLTGTERKYSFVIWGHSKTDGGRALIEVGYKREF